MKKFDIFSIQFVWLWIILAIIQLSFSEAKANKTVKIPLMKGKPFGHIKKRDVSRLPMSNVEDDYYYGWIKCGTPGQDLRMIFDTGSPDMWVMSAHVCREDPSICEKCEVNLYDSRRSRTFRDIGTEWSVEYQDDSYFSGFWCQDNVQVANILIEDHVFAEATYVEREDECVSYDGIFGLAYHNRYKPTSAFRNMMRQGLVDFPIFSFYLNNERDDSQLIFGGADPQYYTGRFCYSQVVAKDSWTIECDLVCIGSRQVMGRCEALVDSGTSWILGPPDFMNAFKAIVGDPEELDCEDVANMSEISFVINGCRLSLSPDDYMIKEEDEDQEIECMCGIDASDTESFVLGNVFMKKYYSVFNMEEGTIGFALARK